MGSIVDTNVLREATADVDVVFHFAAKLHILEPQERSSNEYEQINVEGTRRLLQAAVDKLVGDVAVKSDKIQRTLGFQPAFDLHRGWRATLDGLASDEPACDIKSQQKP